MNLQACSGAPRGTTESAHLRGASRKKQIKLEYAEKSTSQFHGGVWVEVVGGGVVRIFFGRGLRDSVLGFLLIS